MASLGLWLVAKSFRGELQSDIMCAGHLVTMTAPLDEGGFGWQVEFVGRDGETSVCHHATGYHCHEDARADAVACHFRLAERWPAISGTA